MALKVIDRFIYPRVWAGTQTANVELVEGDKTYMVRCLYKGYGADRVDLVEIGMSYLCRGRKVYKDVKPGKKFDELVAVALFG